MTMADKIVVMENGLIKQIGTPMEVYNNPANLFVASFIGTPGINLFEAEVDKENISFLGIKEKSPKGIIEKINELYDAFIEETEKDIKELEGLLQEHPRKKKRAWTKKAKKALEALENNPLTYENQLDSKSRQLEKAKLARESEVKTIVIGVRPSDVVIYDESNKGLTAPIEFQLEERELLGQDVLIHLLKNETRFISSINAMSKVETNKFAFNKDKLFFFDPISTKRI